MMSDHRQASLLERQAIPLATWSPCRNYRYTLRRLWSSAEVPRVVTWILLNPSTADEHTDDPTIRRCVGFSKSWGFDELMIVNAYAWRSTDPHALFGVPDPVGPDNDMAILDACRRARLIVCGWGKHLQMYRARQLQSVLEGYPDANFGLKLSALKLNGDGSPAHPLYLRGDLQPQPFVFKDSVRG